MSDLIPKFSKKQPNSRRYGSLSPQTAGLMSRVMPAVVLAIGAIWLMMHLENASAQFPSRNQNISAQTDGYPQNRPSYDSGIPTIPVEAMTASAKGPQESNAEAATEDAESESSWQWPTVVSKAAEGGWLMLPLAVCSLIVFSLSLERMIALRRSRVIPRPFVRRFTECVEDGQLSYEEATELCEEFDCPVAEVFQAAVRRWGRPMFEIEQAVMDAGDRVADGLRRFVRVFHAISNVAPLMGLLGTVLGMIEAFETISSQASIGRPEMLASGISVALMTTAGGLSVAIPAYLAYMYFSSKSDRYLGEIDKLCQRVIDCISAEGLENNNSPKTNAKRKRAA
ncbi:colicin uptake protein TolQ [Novipirellula aureliae]|uniref:Colicin uptake protein TolQ n=1 Tax=Novipirellula aureliae TaxID=2527966 RepID=A0A5C6DJZ3_9BACT|nr:MotA/TolQ/ExbB proton channel family protein [Novipirellula aureliae]TWU35246.1 colicin uptake protein TolQ [Novipirellula aureliae]